MQLILLSISVAIAAIYANIKYSLDGNDWKITNPYNCSATVPGSVFVDLMNSGLIQDPYYGNNPTTYQWISNFSWTYTKQFNLSQEILSKNIIQLIFEGLDTKADIYLNNELIFSNDNMFHRNYIEIKSLLIESMNNLTILFYSKVKWAIQESNSCVESEDSLCPNGCGEHDYVEMFCDFNYIRTEVMLYIR